jgi:hypothetical protein
LPLPLDDKVLTLLSGKKIIMDNLKVVGGSDIIGSLLGHTNPERIKKKEFGNK